MLFRSAEQRYSHVKRTVFQIQSREANAKNGTFKYVSSTLNIRLTVCRNQSESDLTQWPFYLSGAISTPNFFETPLAASAKATPTASEQGSPTHLPMESPRADDDAASVASSKKSKQERSDLSLNSYLDSYTSEDNKSFQDFMDEAERKHKIKVYSISDQIGRAHV